MMKSSSRFCSLSRSLTSLLLVLLTLGVSVSISFAQPNQEKYIRGREKAAAHKPDQILVKFKGNVSEERTVAVNNKHGAKVLRKYRNNPWRVVKLPPGLSVEDALARFRNEPEVEEVEPDYEVHATATPNDPSFGSQWDMTKIQAPTAWDSSTGSTNVVVAVIDTGVDYNHADLKANMWHNPGETAGNSKDDDGNGYVDDIYGINAAYGTSNPLDDEDHGTHCAGSIGAVGNNSTGISGVNWNIRIMALKFLDSSGSGYDSDAITCLDYVTTMKKRGVNIVATSNSWGGPGYSSAMKNAFDTAYNAGVLAACAAGNDGYNNDNSNPDYPSSYTSAGIISVAASDSNDNKPSWSNYGATSVDLAAPGASILSTVRGGYATYSGTSMATPHVAGAIGLLAAYSGSLSAAQLKQTILSNVDVLSQWQGVVATGGRLNLAKALGAVSPTATPTPTPTPAPTVTRQADLDIRSLSEASSAASGNNVYNADGTNQNRAQSVAKAQSATFVLGVQNDGSATEPLIVTGPASINGWTLAYLDSNGNNITPAVTTSTGWSTPLLAAGARTEIQLSITASAPTTASTSVLVTAKSTDDITKKDTVKATVSLLGQPDLMVRKSTETDAQYALDNVYQSTPSGGQISTQSVTAGTKAVFKVRLQNDTASSRTFILKASESASNLAAWSIVYTDASGYNISTSLRSSTGRTSVSLAAGASQIIYINITPLSGAGLQVGNSVSVDVSAYNDAADVSAGNMRDVVRSAVTVAPPLIVANDAAIRTAADSTYTGEGIVNLDGTNQIVSQSTAKGTAAIYYVRMTNTGNADDRIRLAGSSGNGYYAIRYYDNQTSGDITSAVTGGSWYTAVLSPAGNYVVRVQVTPTTYAYAGSSHTLTITTLSRANTNKKDVVKEKTSLASTTSTSSMRSVEENSASASASSTIGDESNDDEVINSLPAYIERNEIHLDFRSAGIWLDPVAAIDPLYYMINMDDEEVAPRSIRYDTSSGEVVFSLRDILEDADIIVQWSNLPQDTGGSISGTAYVVS